MPAGRFPKPDEKLVSRHPKVAMRMIKGAKVVEQPPLPRTYAWPARTKEWWKMWGASPLTDDFTDNDWSELMDTAVFHARLWDTTSSATERMNAGKELRQRAAKFGATPEDRVRLRIQFAFADTAEEKAEEAKLRRAARTKGSRARRGPTVSEAG